MNNIRNKHKFINLIRQIGYIAIYNKILNKNQKNKLYEKYYHLDTNYISIIKYELIKCIKYILIKY